MRPRIREDLRRAKSPKGYSEIPPTAFFRRPYRPQSAAPPRLWRPNLGELAKLRPACAKNECVFRGRVIGGRPLAAEISAGIAGNPSERRFPRRPGRMGSTWADFSYFGGDLRQNGHVRRGRIRFEGRRSADVSERFPETSADPSLISGDP